MGPERPSLWLGLVLLHMFQNSFLLLCRYLYPFKFSLRLFNSIYVFKTFEDTRSYVVGQEKKTERREDDYGLSRLQFYVRYIVGS
jgi:hypothetical protein